MSSVNMSFVDNTTVFKWVPLPAVPFTRRLAEHLDSETFNKSPLIEGKTTTFKLLISPFHYGYGDSSDYPTTRTMNLIFPGEIQVSLLSLLKSLPQERYVSLLTLTMVLLSLPSEEILLKVLSLISLSKKETKMVIHLVCSFPEVSRIRMTLESLIDLPDYFFDLSDGEESGDSSSSLYPSHFRKAIDSVLWSIAMGKSSWLDMEKGNPELIKEILGVSVLTLLCPKTAKLFPNPYQEMRKLEFTDSGISLKMNLRDSGFLMLNGNVNFHWELRKEEELPFWSKAFLERVHPSVLYRLFSFLEGVKFLMLSDTFEEMKRHGFTSLERSTLPYQESSLDENNGFDIATGTIYLKSDYGDSIHAELAWKLANLIEKAGFICEEEYHLLAELLWLSPETSKMIHLIGVLMDLGSSFTCPSYYHQISASYHLQGSTPEETLALGRPLILKRNLINSFPKALSEVLEKGAWVDKELIGQYLDNPLISSNAPKVLEAFLFDYEIS